jgi:CRISPR-associated protein Cas1
MAWRGLHISRAAHLSLNKGRIKVFFFEEEESDPLFFPIEDAAWVILDNCHSTLSARLISACMEASTPIIFSDTRHHPCGMALSFHQHHAQTQISRMQISLSRPFKKRIWSQIVRTKIINQAQTLSYQQSRDSQVLANMARTVRSGDPKNVEARAARFYWSRLFDNFSRSDESDIRNGLLNYGYACARATIARAAVAAGFIPSIGLHHDGRLNAFNLVDDLIEPFRPVIDRAVVEHMTNRASCEQNLTLEDRREMAAVLTRELIVEGQQLSLLSATEHTTESLRRAVQENKPELLKFPEGW